MKRVFLLVMGMMMVSLLSAQNDQRARQLLEQTSKKMQSFQTLSASFLFTMENSRMGINEKNSGSLLLKGSKYQVKLPDLGMQVFCDGKTVWNFMEAANQVLVSNAGDDSQGVIDPSMIFNVYQEGFRYSFIEEKTVGGKTIAFMDLVPDDKSGDFTKITVGVDKNALMVHSLVTHGKDGNLYGIYVNDYKTNQPINDSQFVFNKTAYPRVEEIDFR